MTELHKSQYPSTFYRVSVKAVIRNEKGEILVAKEYDNTNWSLPGGGWDHDETEHEALARELQEEVRYEGDFTSKPLGTAVFWLESRQAWLLWIVYEVKTENMNFSVGEECSEVAFVHPKEFSNFQNNAQKWMYENLT